MLKSALTVACVDPVCWDEVPFCEEVCRPAAILAYGKARDMQEGERLLCTISKAGLVAGQRLHWSLCLKHKNGWHMMMLCWPAVQQRGSAAGQCWECAAAGGLQCVTSDAAAGQRTSVAGTVLLCWAVCVTPAGIPDKKRDKNRQVFDLWPCYNTTKRRKLENWKKQCPSILQVDQESLIQCKQCLLSVI